MTSNTSTLRPATEEIPKKRLTANEYRNLCDFINNYQGLPIDCEMELQDNFSQIQRLTLKAILQTELTNRMRSQYWRYDANAKKYLTRYEELSMNSPGDSNILLNIAREERIGPVMMCRSLLKTKYDFNSKMKLTKLMRYPHLIEDPLLSANVAQCLCSDSQDGPLIDLKRRVLGEEYEFKLKEMANKSGMHYYDENDLRRLGYDKTPDIKMILPFLYKGEVINWIESKANFGDIKTHKWNIQQQLNSYCNRFGAGIIIYWFGYHESTPKLPDNSIGIIVLDDFPLKSDIKFLDLSENIESDDQKVVEET
ncbi:CDAN1-interacting nuclease 1 [Calliphora vicina]|uniref:CDAN1-interacting nuclease 1 n=1 Tax=Calliphora vicina TaxID=7373 RepID=UPI00325B7A10